MKYLINIWYDILFHFLVKTSLYLNYVTFYDNFRTHLGPYCLQCWLAKNINYADNKSHDRLAKGLLSIFYMIFIYLGC